MAISLSAANNTVVYWDRSSVHLSGCVTVWAVRSPPTTAQDQPLESQCTAPVTMQDFKTSDPLSPTLSLSFCFECDSFNCNYLHFSDPNEVVFSNVLWTERAMFPVPSTLPPSLGPAACEWCGVTGCPTRTSVARDGGVVILAALYLGKKTVWRDGRHMPAYYICEWSVEGGANWHPVSAVDRGRVNEFVRRNTHLVDGARRCRHATMRKRQGNKFVPCHPVNFAAMVEGWVLRLSSTHPTVRHYSGPNRRTLAYVGQDDRQLSRLFRGDMGYKRVSPRHPHWVANRLGVTGEGLPTLLPSQGVPTGVAHSVGEDLEKSQ